VAVTGTAPTFDLYVDGAGLPALSQIIVDLRFVAEPPQLCVRLVPTTQCAIGQTVDGRLSLPPFDVTALTSVDDGGAEVVSELRATVTAAEFDAAASCGQGVVAGTATAVGTGRPLPGVPVTLRDPSSGAVIATVVTDAAGRYRFEGLTPGDYRVDFSSVGAWTVVGPDSSDASVEDGGEVTVHGIFQQLELPPTGGGSGAGSVATLLALAGVVLLGTARQRKPQSQNA